MLDITLRSLSLLVYLFLISYFFSNWSTAIKSHREFYNHISHGYDYIIQCLHTEHLFTVS